MSAGTYPHKGTPLAERFWSKVAIGDWDDCWPWRASLNVDGYGNFGYEGSSMGAHRMAWILIVGGIPEGLQVLHSCDNPRCVNTHHLFLGTHLVNIADKVAKKRQWRPYGERNHFSVLTTDKIVAIKSMLLDELTLEEIAKREGVTKGCISLIKRGKTWGHIK